MSRTDAPETLRGRVDCDNCGEEHAAEYSHPSQYGNDHVYAVVCPKDHLTDYYTQVRLK